MTQRTESEKKDRQLVRAAEMLPWDETLRDALARACRNRGLGFSRHADCGELAELLEAALPPATPAELPPSTRADLEGNQE